MQQKLVRGESKPKHLRPIGLCTIHYKILSKFFVDIQNKIFFLKNNLTFLRSFSEKVNKLQIFSLQLKKFNYSMHNSKSKMGWLIIKIDINKAFYGISWTCILEMLNLLNFPNYWINIIKSCLENTSYNPIINGVKIYLFALHRCIKQSDLISPYLFIIAMHRDANSP